VGAASFYANCSSVDPFLVEAIADTGWDNFERGYIHL